LSFEAFHKAFSLVSANFGSAVFNFIQLYEELKGMGVHAPELTPIILTDHLDQQSLLFVEWQSVIVQHRHSRLRLLGGVQKAEGIAAIGVHHGVQIDPAPAFHHTNVERSLGEQCTRLAACQVFFPIARIILLDPHHLFGSQRNGFLGRFRFQFNKPLTEAGYAVLDQDVLDRGGTYGESFQFEHAAQLVTAPGEVQHSQCQHALQFLWWCGEGMGLVDRGNIFQPRQSMGLKSVLALVTDRSGYSSLPAGFTHIPECLCQFQDTQLVQGYFITCFLCLSPLY
jgi:hypothetical protein